MRLEINNYNESKENKIKEFHQLKLNNTNKLLELINPILKKYSDQNSISLIIQKKNLVMGKSELDITDNIILIINNEIKEIKVK